MTARWKNPKAPEVKRFKIVIFDKVGRLCGLGGNMVSGRKFHSYRFNG